MATTIPNTLKGRLLGDNSASPDPISTAIDLEADTFKMMLLTSSHTISADNDVFIDDVSANEVSGTGYTAGGLAIVPVATTNDSGDSPASRGILDAPDVNITTATVTARYAIFYKDTGTPGTSPIVVEYDFGSDKTSTAGTFTIQVNSSGLLTST